MAPSKEAWHAPLALAPLLADGGRGGVSGGRDFQRVGRFGDGYRPRIAGLRFGGLG